MRLKGGLNDKIAFSSEMIQLMILQQDKAHSQFADAMQSQII